MSISVSYGSHAVTDGIELTKTQTHSAPEVKIQADDSTLVTLLMTDPDAPSRENPVRAEWMHWAVANIEAGDVSSGDTVVEYNGPSPPPGTGKHRYIFTAYAQTQGRIKVTAPSGRNNFDSKAFASTHHLTALASTQFVCQTPPK